MAAGVLIPPDRDSANVVDDVLQEARAAVDGGVRACGWASNSTMTQSLWRR
jgi:hypothetical protein